MARKGIRPLSTAIARAFSSGSSTTSQRPTPKKRTNTRITPAQPAARRMRKKRERLRRTEAGFSVFAIEDPAHTIAGRRSGQSVAVTVHCRFFAEDACVRWSPAGRGFLVWHLVGRPFVETWRGGGLGNIITRRVSHSGGWVKNPKS